MSEANSTPSVEGAEHEAATVKKPGKAPIVLIVSAIAAISIAAAFFTQQAHSLELHKPYATGEQYTVSGYCEKVSKEPDRTSNRGRTANRTVCTVTFRSTEPLPNGDEIYESSDCADYNRVRMFADQPDTLVSLTIDADGRIAKAEIPS